MNEPQLSAEMDRKFDNEFPYTVEKYTAVAKSFKHFLATALEEQRAEIETFCSEQYDEQLKKETHDSASAYSRVIAFINGKGTV